MIKKIENKSAKTGFDHDFRNNKG